MLKKTYEKSTQIDYEKYEKSTQTMYESYILGAKVENIILKNKIKTSKEYQITTTTTSLKSSSTMSHENILKSPEKFPEVYNFWDLHFAICM